MILAKLDYNGFHAVSSSNGYTSHIRIYKIGDKNHNLIYERSVKGDIFYQDELEYTLHKFVDKYEKIQSLRKKIKEVENEN